MQHADWRLSSQRCSLEKAALNRSLLTLLPGWSTQALEEAVSLTQHHDAITGTEKQHVANDYHQRLSKGAHTAVVPANSARLPAKLTLLYLPAWK